MSETKKTGFATAGLVVGIVGIALSFIPVVNNAAFILGILAVAFSIVTFVKKASKGKAIAALILGILAIVITIIMQHAFVKGVNDAVDEINSGLDSISSDLNDMSGDNTEKVMKEYVNVEIGAFEATNDEYFPETKLPVTIKNISDKTRNYTISIEAIDASGKRLEKDVIYVDNLGAGQSQDFEAFTLISNDKIEILKAATFKVYEATTF